MTIGAQWFISMPSKCGKLLISDCVLWRFWYYDSGLTCRCGGRNGYLNKNKMALILIAYPDLGRMHPNADELPSEAVQN